MAGVLLVCVAACLWGTVGVASALMSATGQADPFILAFARTGLGAVCLLGVAGWLRLPWPERGTFPIGLILIFGVGAATFQIFLFAAFAHVGITETVAVTVCAPVLLVALADALWARSVPHWGVLVAIGLGALGVVMAVPTAAGDAAGLLSGGQAFLLLGGASVAFAVLAIATRKLTRRLHPVRAAGLGLAVSSVLLLGACAAMARPVGLSGLGALSWPDTLILLYIGIGATGGAYLAFVFGMHLSSSAPAGLAASMIEPGVAALLAALLLQERLTVSALVGCTLMMLAMVLLAREERRRVPPAAGAAGLISP
jgi:DME family drug/metabolite transporter